MLLVLLILLLLLYRSPAVSAGEVSVHLRIVGIVSVLLFLCWLSSLFSPFALSPSPVNPPSDVVESVIKLNKSKRAILSSPLNEGMIMFVVFAHTIVIQKMFFHL